MGGGQKARRRVAQPQRGPQGTGRAPLRYPPSSLTLHGTDRSEKEPPLVEPESSSQRTGRSHGRAWLFAAVVAFAVVVVSVHRELLEWTDKTTVFLGVLTVLFLLGLLVVWSIALFGPGLWRVVRSVALSAGRAVARDPELDMWLNRHPRLGGWLRRRLTLASPTGWYLTATVLFAAGFLWRFIEIAYRMATASAIVRYDAAVTGLMVAFRTPNLTRFMWAFTVAGDAISIAVLTAMVTLVLLAWGKRAYALLVPAAMVSAFALETALKGVFGRPRPPQALALIHTPGSFSFPSGHAFESLVFFGLVAFIGVLSTRTGWARALVVVLAGFAALPVGLSRIYLGVHWMTDVLASWALALAWLSAWIGAFLIWERYGKRLSDGPVLFSSAGKKGLLWRRAVTVLAFALVLAVMMATAQTDPLLGQVIAPPATQPLPVAYGKDGLLTISGADAHRLPIFSEKLDGSAQNPIGLVFVGTRGQLVSAFDRAGWSVAAPATLPNLLHAVVSATADQPYPNAPVTPSFLAARVQDLAFETPEGKATVRRRHHNRWWLTDLTVAGRPIWVATASFDSRLEIGSAIPLPTHHIEPNIDAERDYVARSLSGTGLVADQGLVRVTPPLAGTDAQGDKWYTAGQAAVLTAR